MSVTPETKSKFLGKILGDELQDDDPAAFTRERQATAQAFNLNVEWRDGRRKEGFAWSHYVGYRWTDDGDVEKLAVVFGERAVEIEGHNLGVLVTEIREGQLNGIRELASGQGMLLQKSNPDNQPIILGVTAYPEFDEILTQIKGEKNDKDGFARRLER